MVDDTHNTGTWLPVVSTTSHQGNSSSELGGNSGYLGIGYYRARCEWDETGPTTARLSTPKVRDNVHEKIATSPYGTNRNITQLNSVGKLRVGDNTLDSITVPSGASRATLSRPDTSEARIAKNSGDIVERLETLNTSAFSPGHEGVVRLQEELKRDVDEDNWVGRAAAATGLDILDLAMSFTEGTAASWIDTLRLGEGIREGGWEGFKADLNRLLNLTAPRGRVLSTLQGALAVSSMAEDVTEGNIQEAVLAAAFSLLAGNGKGPKTKKKRKKKRNNKKRSGWHSGGKNTGRSSQEVRDNLQKVRGLNYENKVDPFSVTDTVTGRDRHHAVLQAIFRRLVDPPLASFVHEGPTVAIPKKLHDEIHRELNVILQKRGYLEKGYLNPYLSNRDLKDALVIITKYYSDKAVAHPNIKAFGKLRDAVVTFKETLAAGGFF